MTSLSNQTITIEQQSIENSTIEHETTPASMMIHRRNLTQKDRRKNMELSKQDSELSKHKSSQMSRQKTLQISIKKKKKNEKDPEPESDDSSVLRQQQNLKEEEDAFQHYLTTLPLS